MESSQTELSFSFFLKACAFDGSFDLKGPIFFTVGAPEFDSSIFKWFM
eukprot:CAMPEP_0202967396 /NCGR_PEP_ID=MMETSP1396-20130829/12239_1 /ASSEMBLY_ACC=CAM_ASM_000872 /TAXON_ID= /ORGANISM="Pseudokeronopsis sp., Strain Brazil" /LENGTH=47 /DNA_ID= /DNA_START= /DNA_END= /DNA_ORIENTATION=